MFNLFEFTDQLVAYRKELTFQLEQCFDDQHPYNVADIQKALDHVDALIGCVKEIIIDLL